MKKIFFTLFILFGIISISAQTAENPFEKYGFKKVRAFSFSQGEFEEFHDNKEIVEIGSVLFNAQTNEIVGFIEQDSTDISSATPAMTVDPLCEKYPWISPYAFCLNNPVRYNDPDGRAPKDKVMGAAIGLITNVIPGTTGLRNHYSPIDAGDYNNTLRTVDAAAMALGGGMIDIGGGAAVLGGTTALAGATASVASGGTLAAGGLPVAVAGIAVMEAGATTAAAGGLLMVNSTANTSQGYNYGEKSGNKSENTLGSKNAAKGDKMGSNTKANKMIDDIAKKNNLDRKEFGNFIEDMKASEGKGGADNYTWKQLEQMAKDFK